MPDVTPKTESGRRLVSKYLDNYMGVGTEEDAADIRRLVADVEREAASKAVAEVLDRDRISAAMHDAMIGCLRPEELSRTLCGPGSLSFEDMHGGRTDQLLAALIASERGT